MLSNLLTTKLSLPVRRTGLVARPRLIERMNAGLERKLTLVCAPAGSGKTTLLGAWAQDCSRPAAWLSLDEEENDPARFFSYLVAALRMVKPGVGEGALALLRPTRDAQTQPALTALINELAAESDPLLLVLDDYHLIETSTIHEALAFLIEHMPTGMHLAIASRADPPLPLARLRARGQVNEVREHELSFTPEEAQAFFNQAMELDLTQDEVAGLEARTEGWAAGLQLAALSLQQQADRQAFLREFSGRSRHILDYLGEEVLSRQEAEIKAFMLRTSILERLSAPLCDVLTGRSGSQQVLESLESAHLFVVPLDSERRWYRYHRLFADFLRKTAMLELGGELAELHRRASEWYRGSGFVDEAIEHASAAGDYQSAATLIQQEANNRLMRNETRTLLSWMDALPEETVRGNPKLCLQHALALAVTSGDMDKVEARLKIVEETQGDEALLGSVYALRGLIGAIRIDATESEQHLTRALELLPEEDLFLRSLAADNLGMIQMIRGELDEAVESFERAAEMGRQAGNLLVAVGALANMAGIWMLQGKLQRGWSANQRALELATDSQGRHLPVAGKALLGLGSIAREWNDFETARGYLNECIDLFAYFMEVGSVVAYLTLARIEEAEGKLKAAQELVDKARRIAVDFEASKIDDELVEAYQAQLWIAGGELGKAESWLKDSDLEGKLGVLKDKGIHPMQAHLYLTLVRFYLAQKRHEESLTVLEALRRGAEVYKNRRTGIQAEVLQALVHQRMGDSEAAIATLEKALTFGEREGYMRVFLDEGADILELLYKAAGRGITPEYVGRLLAARAAPEGRFEAAKQDGLVEPLSEREVEVLGLIAEGLSNQEIADKLVISLSTVKGHASSIYGKLGVNSRTQAVAAAKQLGILDQP